ncbi:GNAT family N-acetyltransferase [Anaerorhabdus sp.]|jgi:ribosomal protein S18 acetylase RimI-like enzyme|uniref:GNAT family N-acetyltransferase n=1 Tax=Anaerorhabdus sp. TaxID=1872524 RepID=UPI002FCA8729
MKIEKLKNEDYVGKKIVATYTTTGYYEIEVQDETFTIMHKSFDEIKTQSFESTLFDQWLDNPIAYGAFDKDILLGFVEGFLEKWNNRYRISNICIFKEQDRRKGLGDKLINRIIEEAKLSKARMVVLETQSCNEKTWL